MDWVTFTCPAGAETAPISHGEFGYTAYLEDHTDPRSRWVVDVPADVAPYFIGVGGFWPADPVRQAHLIRK